MDIFENAYFPLHVGLSFTREQSLSSHLIPKTRACVEMS